MKQGTQVKRHIRVGLITSLIIFILMMIWASVGMFMDAEIVESPIAFTLQRYWTVAWTIISLAFSFAVMVFTSIASLIIATLKRGIS